ncbi:DMT family transporter [Pelagibacterium montanilacus]|uniref:DMT family transporter n=1 Tax=Pelagibacterium montanilacus TaxID=2185280 RepID=UPI000F8CE590|nr:DMT family transporter [Pelagibacterium montanilacus]
MRLALLTGVAMIAFAANSVLARMALGSDLIDAASYTGIRLISGAALLFVLVSLRAPARASGRIGGGWAGAASLLGYALAFSLAYLMVGAGMGALILFASVQISMLGWALWKGDRMSIAEWSGVALALASLAYLLSPGAAAPNPVGAALMAGAGACWAAYSLIGRGSASPLADTAGNFIRCVPLSLVLLGGLALAGNATLEGILLACASGAIASGLGYAIWYLALPGLSRTQASAVQLTVPAIAALGGIILVGEPLTTRLVLASAGILGGVALALIAADRRKRRALTAA